MHEKKAIIIGAGPAGLTAAFELLMRTDIKPIIIEKSKHIGGLSKTINYKSNRIDIGGHRFFSKSDRVMNWWMKILPIANAPDESFLIRYQNKTKEVTPIKDQAISDPDKAMLIRSRLSRIYFLKQFFDYPISLSGDTVKKLGLAKTFKIGMSYIWARLFPIRNEQTLEHFFINHFGKELYRTFFKDYTEKVWGAKCSEISSIWGAQRIKTLTISKAVRHAIKSQFKTQKGSDLAQKGTETSLIEQFLYPKHGPGQLWEEVARIIKDLGGEIILEQEVEAIHHNTGKVKKVVTKDIKSGELNNYEGKHFFSTMPIQQLIAGMQPQAPINVQDVAKGLIYRDFITVGLLLTELKVKDEEQANKLIRDNWIYIQEREVNIGRLQIFNNWSPYMVNNPEHVWIGLEYFCNVGDELWKKNDDEFQQFAIDELTKIDIIEKDKVLDSTIIREEKTYPAYFGTYDRFDEIKNYTNNNLENMYLIGRNGMHKYNNSDHSMLTAMVAVDNIVNSRKEKDNIWNINTEQDYHEEK